MHGRGNGNGLERGICASLQLIVEAGAAVKTRERFTSSLSSPLKI